MDGWKDREWVDEQMHQSISRRAHNIPRAAGVGGKHLYRINSQSNPSITLSDSSFQKKRTLEHVL